MKISKILQEATRQLEACGIEESDLDARLLLEFVTGMSRSELILGADTHLDPVFQSQFFELVQKRSNRLPLSYITETREFWSLDFFISPSVLIPRPETEFLVEQVLRCVQSKPDRDLSVLDMCTGSGVIATVLEKELGCRVTAVDVSLDALAVARKNFLTHCKEEPLAICSNLFSGLSRKYLFDLIVCNPPYIEHDELNTLQPEVGKFEPRLALDGGKDGFEIIKKILEIAPNYLKEGGWLFMEIGDRQKKEILSYSQAKKFFQEAEVLCDWAGRDRVFKARCFSSGAPSN